MMRLIITGALAITVTLLASIGGAYALVASEIHRSQAQGRAIEAKICDTLDGLANLKPPAGSPADNPSRAYLQQQHARLVELGSDLGCGR